MAFALMGNKHPFSIESKFTYLARPEPLVLMDISYEHIDFVNFDLGHHNNFLEETEKSVKTRYMLYQIFTDNPDKGH